ncbi:hypothetical protein ABZX75_03420 [Streptomyces sp. NPDC003038]|uniref:hypothetical protein n=1 Tax=unclassified Streptomyces TaxID=2593676 RepID=UPI0033A7A09D
MRQGSEPIRSGRPAAHNADADAADTILHRFEQWARDTPDAHAVIAGPDSLTRRAVTSSARIRSSSRHAARYRASYP